MSTIDGYIEPSVGDVYHFETLAELDDYIEYEDTGQARRARQKAVYLSLAIGAGLALLLILFRHSLGSQLLILVSAGVLWGGHYLYELLELCDD